MLIFCNERIINEDQINELFYPKESISKGILHEIQPENLQKTLKKKDHFFQKAFFGMIFSIALVSFVSISIYKRWNIGRSPRYEERKQIIEKVFEDVMCNLFFSLVSSEQNSEQVNAIVCAKKIHLILFFKDFLEDYFQDLDNIEERLPDFYFPLEKAQKVINFMNRNIPAAVRHSGRERLITTLSKKKFMQILVPDFSKEAENAAIEYFIPLDSFSELMPKFPIAEKIAKRLISPYTDKEVEFQKGLNISNEALLFLESFVFIDKSVIRKILGIVG